MIFIMFRFQIIWVFIFLVNFTVLAQQEPVIDDPEIDLQLRMAPLDTLIEVALKNSPYLKFEETLINRGKNNIRLARRDFHSNLTGFYNYALGNQRFLIGGGGATEQVNNFLDGYRYGFNLSVPLTVFTTRNLKIKQSKAELEGARYRHEQVEMELRKQVIVEYNNLIVAQRVLRIQTTGRENTLLVFQM